MMQKKNKLRQRQELVLIKRCPRSFVFQRRIIKYPMKPWPKKFVKISNIFCVLTERVQNQVV